MHMFKCDFHVVFCDVNAVLCQWPLHITPRMHRLVFRGIHSCQMPSDETDIDLVDGEAAPI